MALNEDGNGMTGVHTSTGLIIYIGLLNCAKGHKYVALEAEPNMLQSRYLLLTT